MRSSLRLLPLLACFLLAAQGACAKEAPHGPPVDVRQAEWNQQAYTTLRDGGQLYLGRVARLDIESPHGASVDYGRVRLKVLRTLHGQAREELVLPFAAEGAAEHVGPLIFFEIWPSAPKLRGALVLCFVLPHAVDKFVPASDDLDTVATRVILLTGEDDPRIAAAAAMAAMMKVHGIEELTPLLKAAAHDERPLLQEFAADAASDLLAEKDPLLAMDLVHRAIKAALAKKASLPRALPAIHKIGEARASVDVFLAMVGRLAEIACYPDAPTSIAALNALESAITAQWRFQRASDRRFVPGALRSLPPAIAIRLRAVIKQAKVATPASSAPGIVERWLDANDVAPPPDPDSRPAELAPAGPPKRTIGKYLNQPYAVLHDGGGIYICKMKAYGRMSHLDDPFEWGRVDLDVVRTIVGEKHDTFTVPFSHDGRERVKVITLSLWPSLAEMKEKTLLCLYLPGAIDSSAPAADLRGAMTCVSVLKDGKDPQIDDAVAIASLYALSGKPALLPALKEAASRPGWLVRQFVVAAAIAEIKPIDPVAEMDILQKAALADDSGRPTSDALMELRSVLRSVDTPVVARKEVFRCFMELVCSSSEPRRRQVVWWFASALPSQHQVSLNHPDFPAWQRPRPADVLDAELLKKARAAVDGCKATVNEKDALEEVKQWLDGK